MRPKVPRGTKASKALPIANSKVSGDKSFADDLNKERGIVSCVGSSSPGDLAACGPCGFALSC